MGVIYPLRNSIRGYPWGSRSSLARFLGQDVPSEQPQAELWMGAHPTAPSRVEIKGHWVGLDEVIRRAPLEILGAAAAERYDGKLPFLFKVLAADQALSIQAHPDRRQARTGFCNEDAQRIPRDGPERNYPDANHKPEILYALEPFWILRGFRPPAEILELMNRLGIGRWLPESCAALGAGDLEGFFTAYMSVGAERLGEALQEALARIEPSVAEGSPFFWVLELERQCPGDPGVLAPLFLHLLELQPGEAIFTGPGILHAYLSGLGVELMANSDNVVRGGLTSKHIDVGELLSILRFEPEPPCLLSSAESDGERRFDNVAEEFDLSVIVVREEAPHVQGASGVEILLCGAGEGRLVEAGSDTAWQFGPGDALLVPAVATGYRIEGAAVLYKACVP